MRKKGEGGEKERVGRERGERDGRETLVGEGGVWKGVRKREWEGKFRGARPPPPNVFS